MSQSVELLVQGFLEACTDLVALVPTDRISAMSVDRKFDLNDGPVAFYREISNNPQNSLAGWSGLTQHSYAVSIMSHDADEASSAATALKNQFRDVTDTRYRPSGWVAGEAWIEGGEIRDGNTNDFPEVVSDEIIVQKILVIDLWIQE